MNDYQEREASLNLKIKFLQRKIRELKEEMDYRCGAIRDAKAKISAAKEIEGLREHMKSSLNEEVTKKTKENDNLRKTINSLLDEKFDIENENNYFKSKISQLKDENSKLSLEGDNLNRKGIYMERDLQNIRDKQCIKEKSHSNSLNDNDYQNSVFDKISNDLILAKNKNEELFSKINEVREKITSEKEGILYERKLYEDVVKINEKLNEKIVKGKQDLNTLEIRIKNIRTEMKEKEEMAMNSQRDGGLLVKKLQNLYDQLYAINSTNYEVNIK